MTYTHKPTQLGGVDPEKDRCVWFKGGVIGRVRFSTTHVIAGQWQYNGFWKGDQPRNGYKEGKAEALAELKGLHIADGQPPPNADATPTKKFGYKWKRGKGE